jgi:hypothetical protein
MRRKLLTALAASAVLAVVASSAFAAAQVVFKASASPAKAGQSTALDVQFAASEPGQPQPPIMNRVVIKFHKGGKYNNAKFPRCNLASLQAKGPNGCPSGSKIGSGSGIGRALPVVEDPVNAKLGLFNGSKVGGKDTVLVYVFPDLGPTFVSVCKITKKTQGSFDYTLDCNIPPIKTLPSAPDASTVSVKTKTQKKTIKKSGKKYPLTVAPKKCSGTWKAEAQFFFTNGETVKSKYSGKCSK